MLEMITLFCVTLVAMSWAVLKLYIGGGGGEYIINASYL